MIVEFPLPVSSHEGEGWLRALQEANLASEVGIIVLDALGSFTTHCRDILTSDGAEAIMQQVSDCYCPIILSAAYMFFLNRN